MTKEARLHQLLVDLFDASELHFLISSLPDSRAIAAELPPRSSTSSMELAYAAVDALSRRGALDTDFFELLLSLRPARARQIRDIRDLWEPRPEDWSAPPEENYWTSLMNRLRRSRKRQEVARVFVSYARRDRVFYEELLVHLAVLLRQGVIDLWDDGRILAGGNWEAQIRDAIDAATVFVVLVSPDFLASEYSSRHELQQILTRQRQGAQVILVRVRQVLVPHEHPLRSFQWCPSDGTSITAHSDTDEAWLEIATAIQLAASSVRTP